MKQIIQKITALATVMIICATMCLTVCPNTNDIYLDEKSVVISQDDEKNDEDVCSTECDDDYKKISQ